MERKDEVLMRTWTDESVAIYKSPTEKELRAIIADRDATIVKVKNENTRMRAKIVDLERKVNELGGD